MHYLVSVVFLSLNEIKGYLLRFSEIVENLGICDRNSLEMKR